MKVESSLPRAHYCTGVVKELRRRPLVCKLKKLREFMRFPKPSSATNSSMATVPSSSSPPSLSSASNSDNSPTQPNFNSSTSPKPQVDAGDSNVEDIKSELPNPSHDLYTTSYKDKFKKYEADYTRRLMSKYFSKKNLYGGNIFDENMTIDNEIIKSSRWPCTRSYADPAQVFEDQSSGSPTTITAETPANISNGKLSVKKNG
ncbi:hypothetical protein FNV43_RR20747 [Rhamnella rubrinervis]|uniref:Uncharacterized protein n=1 Tax=Rhamnella rubrinervis TaxID=2594499 RepID=A0A8K0DWI6_9ROSA|nr:hypothetical protein FNV43_RR20747 [Rhamnella rubrinervis]